MVFVDVGVEDYKGQVFVVEAGLGDASNRLGGGDLVHLALSLTQLPPSLPSYTHTGPGRVYAKGHSRPAHLLSYTTHCSVSIRRQASVNASRSAQSSDG